AAMNVVLALLVTTGTLAWYGSPYVPAVIDSTLADTPASRAGFQHGDSVVAVNGTSVRTFDDLVRHVSPAAGTELSIEVVRSGARAVVRVVPESMEVTNALTGEEMLQGRIGAVPMDRVERDPIPLGQAAVQGWNGTWRMAGAVATILKRLVTGRESMENLGGPVAIAQVSVQAAQLGLERLLVLLAFLSVNIG